MGPTLAELTTGSHAWQQRLTTTNANGWRASGGAWVLIGPLAWVPCPWCKERMHFWLGFGLGLCLWFGLGLCLWFRIGSSSQPSLTTCHDGWCPHPCNVDGLGLLVQTPDVQIVCRGMGVWGATPERKQFFYRIVHFKHHHPRYPKTPFLAHGVQGYGCLGCHPRTQTIFSGIDHFKHPHPGCPKHTFFGPWCAEVWMFGAPPQNANNIFLHCPFQTPAS